MNITMLRDNPTCIDEVTEKSCKLRIRRKNKYAFTLEVGDRTFEMRADPAAGPPMTLTSLQYGKEISRDNLEISSTNVHIERMEPRTYWIGAGNDSFHISQPATPKRREGQILFTEQTPCPGKYRPRPEPPAKGRSTWKA